MTTKKVLLFMASVFLAYRSVELLKFLNSAHPTQFNWLGAMAFSFALNLFITGIFAFLGFAFLTSAILPNAYYKIKNAKNLNLIYNILVVDYFKWLLLHFFWARNAIEKSISMVLKLAFMTLTRRHGNQNLGTWQPSSQLPWFPSTYFSKNMSSFFA